MLVLLTIAAVVGFLAIAAVTGALLGIACLKQHETNTQDDLVVNDKNQVTSGDYIVQKRRRRSQPLWY